MQIEKQQDNNTCLSYWLSNTVTLLYLLQKNIKPASGGTYTSRLRSAGPAGGRFALLSCRPCLPLLSLCNARLLPLGSGAHISSAVVSWHLLRSSQPAKCTVMMPATRRFAAVYDLTSCATGGSLANRDRSHPSSRGRAAAASRRLAARPPSTAAPLAASARFAAPSYALILGRHHLIAAQS